MLSVKINGSIEGYFGAQSRLRQGDPMFPYFFVIAMKALIVCLKKSNGTSVFKHHWQTKALDITYLIFADDVLFFSHGDLSSIESLLARIFTLNTTGF